MNSMRIFNKQNLTIDYMKIQPPIFSICRINVAYQVFCYYIHFIIITFQTNLHLPELSIDLADI